MWPQRLSSSATASPAGPDPTTATVLPVRRAGGSGTIQPSVEGALGDRQLDLLDRHRVVVDRQHARRLARRRADPAGELGEVVGRVELVDRLAPLAAVDEVVPVGDQVAERTALVAERDPAVHAPRALALQLGLRLQAEVLLVVVHALLRVALVEADPVDLQERAELAHYAPTASRSAALGEHALVVARHHLDDPLARAAVPGGEHVARDERAGPRGVLGDQRPGPAPRRPPDELLEVDQLEVAAALEAPVDVVHVGDAAAHAGGEVAPGRPEHDHAAAGHVLAAVVADALDDRLGARVADREPLAGEAAEERPPGGGAVQHGVADDHVLLGPEAVLLGRAHRHDAAGQALAGVVVGLAAQRERDPGREPGGEALAGRAA